MRRITSQQQALLDAIKRTFGDIELHWDEERGVASSLRGRLVPASAQDVDAIFRKFLEEYGPLFGPADVVSHLRLLRNRTDDLGWRHLEYQMTHPAPKTSPNPGEELEVWGAKIAAHFDAGGQLIEVQSSCSPRD